MGCQVFHACAGRNGRIDDDDVDRLERLLCLAGSAFDT